MRKLLPFALVAVAALGAASARAAEGAAKPRRFDSDKAVMFLVRLIDPDLRLLPEYAGSKDYWLFHDNYLAAEVLSSDYPRFSLRIYGVMKRLGVTSSGKIEIVLGKAKNPLPFRIPELVTVATVGKKRIRTERLTQRPLRDWQAYADLLLLAAMAEKDRKRAELHFAKALAMWDGTGFHDKATRAVKRYAVYKLALALMAARKLARPLPMRQAILARLAAQQHKSGGVVTDYDAKGRPLGLANVETTSLVILALRE